MRKTMMFLALLSAYLALPGCAGGNTKPVLDIARATCAVVEPICRVATTACGFTEAVTSGGEAAPEE